MTKQPETLAELRRTPSWTERTDMNHTYTMSEAQAARVHALASSHLSALKNWMVTAVERGDLIGAQKLAEEVRAHQAIFAAFNIAANHEIAGYTGRPLEVNHSVDERR